MSNEENSVEENQQNYENEKALAETQKAIAEAQKAAAEAQKAAMEALIPATKLQPQEGKTETDEKFGYISELVAYQSLKESAKEIGKEIDTKLNSSQHHKVLIVHDLDFATEDLPLLHLESLFNYYKISMDNQLDKNNNLIDKMRRRVPPKVGVSGVVLAAAGIVGVAADILGYLKTDYKIAGQDFELRDHAIIANVANSITSVPIHIFKFNLIESSEILEEFEKLLDKKTKLQTTIAILKSFITNARVQNSADHDEVNSAILASETFETAFSSFLESVTKTPEDKTPPLILKAILRKHVRTNNFTHLLNLKILSAGGEAITMQQRIWKSGKLIFIGGCAISYILVKTDGTYVMANTHHGLAHLNYDLGKAKPSLKVQNMRTLDQQNQIEKG